MSHALAELDRLREEIAEKNREMEARAVSERDTTRKQEEAQALHLPLFDRLIRNSEVRQAETAEERVMIVQLKDHLAAQIRTTPAMRGRILKKLHVASLSPMRRR